jgi:hypothetical protein
LPAQDQAQELLERAIGHDAHALEELNRQIENWVGEIRMTDRMRQLEQRSRSPAICACGMRMLT